MRGSGLFVDVNLASTRPMPSVAQARPPSARPLRVEPDEPAVALDEIQDRQVVLHLVGPVAENEVVDVVDIDVELALQARRLVPEAQIETEGRLADEIRIADLEGQIAHVRSEVVQLLERRRTMGTG